MFESVWYIAISVGLWSIWVWFLWLEGRYGQRIFWRQGRERFDQWCDQVWLWWLTKQRQGVVRQLFQKLASGMGYLWTSQKTYIAKWNRPQPYQVRTQTAEPSSSTANHLSAVAQHKADHALSATEKRRLKKRALKSD